MLLRSVVALLVGAILPGRFVAELASAGRSREERWLFAAVAGGPLAAVFYWTALELGAPALYWALTLGFAAGGLFWRSRARLPASWPRASRRALAGIAAGALLPYLLTTGMLYRINEDGILLLDRALQRDVLFHIGILHSLEHDYPPALLSVSGTAIGYHVGYHLELAAFSRFFGVDPMDGLIRLGTSFELVLLVLSAYALARRFASSERARLLSALLLFGTGLGFLAFARPAVDWWSLAFMDVSLVSIFLINPLLPALPLAFAALALLGDYFERGERGALGLGVLLLAFSFVVKMFMGAQALAALGMAAVTGARDRRVWVALAVASLASLPLVAHTVLAASGSNTSVTLRPFEIVRYSMEKLGWDRAVEALAHVGRFDAPPEGLSFVAGVLFLWFVGFCGLRLLALPDAVTNLFGGDLLRRVMAWFVAIGIPIALLFRIAPREAEGLSRLEAQNDVVWFAAQSGLVLWFWTALALSRARPFVAALAVALLALPATVQHFVHEARLSPDRIGPRRVEAALEARAISSPGDVWLEPPDRARPSLLPYLAGRPVVYDSYVGYDYMFVGREALETRRHAVAHFWTSSHPAYAAWMLERFDVRYVWEAGRDVPLGARLFLELLYDNGVVALHRVQREALDAGLALGLVPPGAIPLGGRGHAYFGEGWEWREGENARLLLPGTGRLYLPREEGHALELELELDTPHAAGELRVAGETMVVSETTGRIGVVLPEAEERGLASVELEWLGGSPLRVTGIAAMLAPDADSLR